MSFMRVATPHDLACMTARSSSSRAASGFTLIEALIVVVILVSLISLAAPSFSNLVRSEAIKTASFDVFSSLVLARNEAITRNSTVTVTPNGGDWVQGWEIKDAATGTVIRKQNALGNNIAITGPASVSYTGSGRLSAALASGFNLVDSGTGRNTRCIIVDLSGRPVVKPEACT
jgi:type IV fimbrial biogenesis protein FimT